MSKLQTDADTTETKPNDQLTDSVTDGGPDPDKGKPVKGGNGLPPIAALPEPSQEVLDAPPPDEPSDPEPQAEPPAEQYDPAIHESPPRRNARGGWARKRGGARGGRQPTTPRAEKPGTVKGQEQAHGPTPADLEQETRGTAAVAAGVIFIAGEMIIGDCMRPTPEERAGMTDAFYDFFQSTGIVRIPPWLGLLCAIGLYGGSRWKHPQFAAKRALIFGKKKDEEKAGE